MLFTFLHINVPFTPLVVLIPVFQVQIHALEVQIEVQFHALKFVSMRRGSSQSFDEAFSLTILLISSHLGAAHLKSRMASMLATACLVEVVGTTTSNRSVVSARVLYLVW